MVNIPKHKLSKEEVKEILIKQDKNLLIEDIQENILLYHFQKTITYIKKGIETKGSLKTIHTDLRDFLHIYSELGENDTEINQFIIENITLDMFDIDDYIDRCKGYIKGTSDMNRYPYYEPNNEGEENSHKKLFFQNWEDSIVIEIDELFNEKFRNQVKNMISEFISEIRKEALTELEKTQAEKILDNPENK